MKISKKIIRSILAVSCVGTVAAVPTFAASSTLSVVSASAASVKTANYDATFNQAYHSAMCNSATYDRSSWSGSHPIYHGKTCIGKSNQNYKTGMVVTTYRHPKAGYSKQCSTSVQDKSGKYAYVQQYGMKKGSKQLQKIGHARRVNIVYG